MSFMNLEEKLKKDCAEIVDVMLHHKQARYMVQVLQKGPPKDLGYMWGLDEPGYWTENEKAAINTMHVWVLQKGWESSGYAIMFRSLEASIKKLDSNTLRALNSEP